MFVATNLVAALRELRCTDPEVQRELDALRRELTRERDAGTPWRARGALDVIAMLDMPAWASLSGLLGECPVLPAAMTAIVEGHTRAVSATAFEFISTTRQIAGVQSFVKKLPDVLFS
jgi:hypothetical protein